MDQGLALIAAVTKPPLYIDLAAVFLGGLSGAIFGAQRKFDLTGVLAVAVATGLGGGIVRDILLQNGPPVALTEFRYLPTAVVAAFVGFFFASLVKRGRLMLTVLDPIWMGLFAVIGAEKALNLELTAFGAIVVGCITAMAGGVLRDILAGERPELVQPGPVNYLAVIFGSTLYVAMVQWLGSDKSVAELTTIATVFAIRMVALKFGIKTPAPVDLPRSLPAATRRRRRRRPPAKSRDGA